ncbi:hypothetical protein BU23DRAFT_564212 [Bimuria novae-zelandiae CBS 107.79]|uniref:Uncharacterized protein n=1 Tax=Bimuria novae-zelandiae CBS 107.79 TaxID=1447943 RepID=A0A6A5VQ04_9PLEO|nr:hypothetical protein BU23DRAFT_564212 [Bimuria novae-zelandiae CBS 107.79]
MSNIIAFKHPLAAYKPALDTSPPTAQDCSKLAALKAKSFDELLALSSSLYQGQESLFETVVSAILNDTTSSSVEHKLAETLYFRQGHLLSRSYHVGDMTRSQKEHEIFALNFTTREELAHMGDFALDLKLRFYLREQNEEHFSERLQNAAGYPTKQEPPSSVADSGYDSSSYNSDGDDSPSQSEDDEPMEEDKESEADEEEEFGFFVKVWKPELGRYQIFAY